MKKLMWLVFAGACAVSAQSASAQAVHLNSGKGGLPFSEAVKVGSTLYLSGQVGMDGKTGLLVPGGIEAESRQTMANIQALLERHGYAMKDVVKCTVLLADLADWKAFNQAYTSHFETDRFPARSAVGVNGLALSARVEVECLAAQ